MTEEKGESLFEFVKHNFFPHISMATSYNLCIPLWGVCNISVNIFSVRQKLESKTESNESGLRLLLVANYSSKIEEVTINEFLILKLLLELVQIIIVFKTEFNLV